MTGQRFAKSIEPDKFEMKNHYYEKVRNAQLHPLVRAFLSLSNDQIVERYCHMHPEVNRDKLQSLLFNEPHNFRWAGADLFPVTTSRGNRRMVVIETNSCPSGQKSMPIFDDNEERGGYYTLIKNSFIPMLQRKKRLPNGDLAVIYDKNKVEASGYAHTISDLTNETVHLVEFYNGDEDPPVIFEEGVMKVRISKNKWTPIRAAFKYVTQKPWNRIPVKTKTYIFNPIITCLAGGRNKLVASKAYDFFNADNHQNGITINIPETIQDLTKTEVKFWIQSMGGIGVVKNPYSNAGQGVYTITNQRELDEFMKEEHNYDLFILQSLIGNSSWSSKTEKGQFYHLGTVPNKRKQLFVADLRIMICTTPKGYRPVAIYARQAEKPMTVSLAEDANSWEMLGTNLSIKLEDNKWTTDTNRLLLMDQRDFNKLGLGIDDLVEAFLQTVFAAVAIDNMSFNLLKKDKDLKPKLFRSLNNDDELLEEIFYGS